MEVMNDPDASNKDRLSAANAILDRAYGKPIQYNENNNTHDAADPLRDLMREIASGSGRIGS